MDPLAYDIPAERLAHPFRDTPPLLQKLEFLVGSFEGRGGYADGNRRFHKNVVGEWVAGGKFLSLRMRVAYPLADGRLDVHEACVMAGVDDNEQRLQARVYTDAGGQLDVVLSHDGHGVSFPDRPPGHRSTAKRVRKILRPVTAGFEEQLEVDVGTGAFETYSSILMRRID